MGSVHVMNIRSLVATHLPKAVIASAIIMAFNAYREGVETSVRLGTEFLLYTLAMFVGFVVVDVVLDSVFDDKGA